MWSYVTKHFADFQANINPQQNEYSDMYTKVRGIESCLNRAYYPNIQDPQTLLIVGSYGKRTAIRSTSDVDVMFFLPNDVLSQYSNHQGNGQSALLQDLRIRLMETYPQTTIRADRQVVVVDYQSMQFEVVPTFIGNQGLLIPDTNDGGRWKSVDTLNEMKALDQLDQATQGHVDTQLFLGSILKGMLVFLGFSCFYIFIWTYGYVVDESYSGRNYSQLRVER